MRYGILYLILIFLLAACSKDHALDCFKSTGADVTETRTIDQFTTVQLNEQVNLNIVKGSDYKIEVTAGKHIIKNITTKVQDNILVIDNTNKCNVVRGYKRQIIVTITVPYLRQVFNEGIGTITFDGNFSQDTTLKVKAESSGDIHVNGSYKQIVTECNGDGDVYLSGSCSDLNIYTNGTNFVHGESMLVSNSIFVETVSLGDCFVNATKAYTFNYRIWNSGNIYYSGDPAQINNVGEGNAKGKLIKKD